MHEAIREILDKIDPNMIFDSHFVIQQLIKYHSDAYLEFAGGINASTGKTLAAHGLIGMEIAKFEPDLITKLEHKAWSENIHGTPSDCTAWLKR